MQRRLLERQELLVFASNCAGANPVPIPLPTVVRVGSLWAGGDIGLPYSALAPRRPLWHGLQLEGSCVQQRFLERQELLLTANEVAGAQPVPVPLPPIVLVDALWA